MKADSIENVIQFLQDYRIKVIYNNTEGSLNRIIEFEIDGESYYIEWWVNQCYLKFKNAFSVPYLPFKHMSVINYSPTTLHRNHLCFYDVRVPYNDSITYTEVPFGSFKIPFN